MCRESPTDQIRANFASVSQSEGSGLEEGTRTVTALSGDMPDGPGEEWDLADEVLSLFWDHSLGADREDPWAGS